jgi:hypothetical protein
MSPVASPPHRPCPYRLPAASTDEPECRLSHSPVASHPRRRAGPPWTDPRPWSTKRGPSARTVPQQNKSEKPEIQYFQAFFANGPWSLENKFRGVPSLRKIHKIAPKTSKHHIFSTTTPNPMILAPKFSESLPLSCYTFI